MSDLLTLERQFRWLLSKSKRLPSVELLARLRQLRRDLDRLLAEIDDRERDED